MSKLLHFSIVLMNSSFENKFHFVISLQGIFMSNWGYVWWSWAKLNDRWRACHKLLILVQGLPLNWIASIAGSLYFLTQFMSSQDLLFLFVISWIFELNKFHFVFLIVFLNFFQLSICLDCQKCSRSLQHCSFHYSFECLVILIIFECLYHNLFMVLANSWTIWLRTFLLQMFSVFISLMVSISFFYKFILFFTVFD